MTTIASLSREVIDSLNKLGNFLVAQMRKAYKDAPVLVGVSDDALQQAPPIFIKVVKDQVELIMCEPFLPRKYLTVVKIQNNYTSMTNFFSQILKSGK